MNESQFKFEKELSIWKDWREDDKNILRKCRDDDMKFWKLNKMVKEWKERDGIIGVFKKYY